MDQKEFERRASIYQEEVGSEAFLEVQGEARQDQRVRDTAEAIKGLRLAGKTEEADELVDQNRDNMDEARREVLRRRGIVVDIEALEEQAEQRRLEKLEAIRKTLTGEETDDEILQKFQLTDDKGKLGKESIESPLFNDKTKVGFGAYVTTVTSFKALVDYNRQFNVATSNVGRADEIRTLAHNEVARSVAEDLGLEFDVARRLVAKMRDGVMPQSSENETYSKSVRRIGDRLIKRYGNDIESMVKEQTEPIFEQHKDER